MGFTRQEYWSGLRFPPPGSLSYPGIELASSALADGFFPTSTTWEAQCLASLTANKKSEGCYVEKDAEDEQNNAGLESAQCPEQTSKNGYQTEHGLEESSLQHHGIPRTGDSLLLVE